jgi:hypothetical protein
MRFIVILVVQFVIIDAQSTTTSLPQLAFARPPSEIYEPDYATYVDKKKGFKNIKSRKRKLVIEDEGDSCHTIDGFSVTNSSMKCNDKYLPIEVEFKINATHSITNEFFMDTHNNQLFTQQKSEENCKIIRRFYVDDENVIIIINHVLSVVPVEFANSYIRNKLYDQHDLWHLFLFVTYHFNEETGQAMYFELVKVIILLKP